MRLFDDFSPEDIRHGTEQLNLAFYRHDQNSGYSFPSHWHEEYEIIYAEEGTYSFLANGQRFCVRKGQALFLDSCTIHTFPEENRSAGAYISIVFGKKFLFPSSSSYICRQFYAEILPQRVSLTQLIAEEPGWKQNLLAQIRRISRLGCAAAENALAIQIALLTILDTLRREKSYSVLQNQRMLQNESVREALLYIHQNYQGDLSVRDIAQSLHISVNHFIRIFRSMLGVTPQKYIQTCRLRQAIAAMSQHSDGSPPSITEIAAEAGFSDANYFARSFKKATGMTPSQYRKTCGADLDKRGLPD